WIINAVNEENTINNNNHHHHNNNNLMRTGEHAQQIELQEKTTTVHNNMGNTKTNINTDITQSTSIPFANSNSHLQKNYPKETTTTENHSRSRQVRPRSSSRGRSKGFFISEYEKNSRRSSSMTSFTSPDNI